MSHPLHPNTPSDDAEPDPLSTSNSEVATPNRTSRPTGRNLELSEDLLRSEGSDPLMEQDEDLEADERTAFLLGLRGDSPLPPRHSNEPSYLEEDFFQLVIRRSVVLVILLFLQSSSSFVLDYFENVLKKNYIIVLYLTMIIGSGGNCGSQSVVFIIKGLATGEMDMNNIVKVWSRELRMGALIVVIVGTAAFARVFFSEIFKFLLSMMTGSELSSSYEFLILIRHTFAVVTSLSLVVMTSIVVGMVLPVLFKSISIDPVHAGPVIQVTMDLLGVIITCLVASVLLP